MSTLNTITNNVITKSGLIEITFIHLAYENANNTKNYLVSQYIHNMDSKVYPSFSILNLVSLFLF